MKNSCKFLLFLCFLALAGGIFYLTTAYKPMSKQEFYTKHHISNNSIIPADFDMEKLYESIVEKHDKAEADSVKSFLIKFMAMPNQYKGFYKPRNKVKFYNAEYVDILHKIGLNDDDIKALKLDKAAQLRKEATFNMSDAELKNEGFYSLSDTALLVSKVGKNIYLVGFLTDCGNSGCNVNMYTKKNDMFEKNEANLVFNVCRPDDGRKIFDCSIIPSGSYLHNLAIEYPALRWLEDRYYEIYNDYIFQYIQNSPGGSY